MLTVYFDPGHAPYLVPSYLVPGSDLPINIIVRHNLTAHVHEGAARAECGYNTFKTDDPNLRKSLIFALQKVGVRFVKKLVETI